MTLAALCLATLSRHRGNISLLRYLQIISNPFHQILNAYADVLKNLSFDRIAGIPYGSLPTATGLALRLNRPMIFPAKKSHGTRRLIEGNFHPGETVVVVDDILISGKSAMEGAQKLESAGLNVHDIVVFMDHGQGVKDRLQENGYRAHAVLTISLQKLCIKRAY